ncbi:hypothetical protein TNIN_247401 [Trichonephila inaurata madagascariensis]|uniref:Uncharacterized protein n=1 Tax=Trichonephila inaurata madagascariensis TaxID=2747483 RepID=A0A8X6WZP4_9ARAC|nr:hypothetical protein TNIN_247401 [Trichonephila inaurata madagascariensis]
MYPSASPTLNKKSGNSRHNTVYYQIPSTHQLPRNGCLTLERTFWYPLEHSVTQHACSKTPPPGNHRPMNTKSYRIHNIIKLPFSCKRFLNRLWNHQPDFANSL